MAGTVDQESRSEEVAPGLAEEELREDVGHSALGSNQVDAPTPSGERTIAAEKNADAIATDGTEVAAFALDVGSAPLDGVNLIEASAGTGKTHTITRLYLRLLLERQCRVEEILVVTFTIAATEELRERIRSLLQKTVEVLSDPVNVVSEDALLEQLARDEKRAIYLRRCREALSGFDRAAIYTIHGFCHRMLREHAFESGLSFGMQLAGDQNEYLEEMIQDHWRRRLYDAPRPFLEHGLSRGLSPESLLAFYRKTAAHPGLEILTAPAGANDDAEPAAPVDAAFRTQFEKVRLAWPNEIDALREFFEGGWLNRRSYAPGRARAALDRAERFLSDSTPALKLPKDFDLLRASVVETRRTRIPGPDTPPFLEELDRLAELCEELDRRLERQALALEAELPREARARLGERKRADEVLSYDDLLQNLERGLADPVDGPVLRDAIRRAFRAALIDEFQDTDQVQWRILEGLFRTPNHCLFLIGDPKQSIYSFRGADVFAYIDAKRGADRCYGLQANYRAVPRLTGSVNTLFARLDGPAGADFTGPFLYPEIPFYPVQAAAQKDPLLIAGQDGSGLVLELLRDASGERAYLAKEAARHQATAAVVTEIKRLLDLGARDLARIGEEPVRAGDVAVLVRTNREAEMVQRGLRTAGVHAIIRSEKSLFHSREAEELARLLRAVEQPHSETALRAALITDLIGTDAAGLERLFDDPEARDRRLRDFTGYRASRNEQGFMIMFRRLLEREHILERLLQLPDGERRVANLLHLGELLYRESLSGPGRETAWLARMRERPGNQDEHLPRLESDERAVQIVTVHFSKGLEYPIVFCPFLWNSRAPGKQEPLLLHDREAGRYRMVPGSARESEISGFDPQQLRAYERAAERERLAEDVRLAYVALTRASHRCYLYWGKINRTADSALAFLLHARADENLNDFQERAKKFSADRIARDLRELIQAGAGSILFGAEETRELSSRPETEARSPERTTNGEPLPGPDQLERRVFAGTIRQGAAMSSFSSLTTHTHDPAAFASSEKPEHADAPGAPMVGVAEQTPESSDTESEQDPRRIFAFPRGSAAGDFFHEVLEHLDFGAPESVSPAVVTALARHGFASEWESCVTRAVQSVLTCPMTAGDREIILESVAATDRLPEMDFTFALPAPGIAPPDAFPGAESDPGFQALRENWPARIPAGYMKGFIDLVFRQNGRVYLLDWKSNHLGDDLECYHRSRLLPVMIRSGYVLQYYVYTLALHRFLRARLPDYDYDRDFGGALYVFLRGVRPARGGEYGVFFDRPSRESLRAFEKALAGGGETL